MGVSEASWGRRAHLRFTQGQAHLPSQKSEIEECLSLLIFVADAPFSGYLTNGLKDSQCVSPSPPSHPKYGPFPKGGTLGVVQHPHGPIAKRPVVPLRLADVCLIAGVYAPLFGG